MLKLEDYSSADIVIVGAGNAACCAAMAAKDAGIAFVNLNIGLNIFIS